VTEEIKKIVFSKQQKLFLKIIDEKYGVKVEDNTAIIPEKIRSSFVGDEKVAITADSGRGFFWQKMAAYIDSQEKSFYRMEWAEKDMPEPLALLAKEGDVFIFWLRVQFEAHLLLEDSIAIAVGEKTAIPIPLDSIVPYLEKMDPVRIKMTPEDFKSRWKILDSFLNVILKKRMISIQNKMFETLKQEMKRIREYYSHLLANTNKHDEKERYRHEQKTLETEHIRKLHPHSLKVLAIPEIVLLITKK
jgi:hypothetical protein